MRSGWLGKNAITELSLLTSGDVTSAPLPEEGVSAAVGVMGLKLTWRREEDTSDDEEEEVEEVPVSTPPPRRPLERGSGNISMEPGIATDESMSQADTPWC